PLWSACFRGAGVKLPSGPVVLHSADGSLCFPSLAGRGSRKGAAQMCMSCHGTGVQVRMHQLLPGMVQQVSTVCHNCQGQGQRISQKDRCKTCAGRKILRQKKILEVHIDKGLTNGSFCLMGKLFPVVLLFTFCTITTTICDHLSHKIQSKAEL
uniref:CR-type domain-containing protein n=1 Tax=Fundulus heteroclitus TaxID=8078 RepID=A0A3Q2P4C1_FUNHE